MYDLPSRVLWDFCRVMDALSDLDWTRFGESQPTWEARQEGRTEEGPTGGASQEKTPAGEGETGGGIGGGTDGETWGGERKSDRQGEQDRRQDRRRHRRGKAKQEGEQERKQEEGQKERLEGRQVE